MKIEFTKLPTIGGKIQVSLDGGQSFTDYNIEDIHDSGIPLDDNQDYEKIQIRGPANLLKNLNVLKNIKIDGTNGSSSENTIDSRFIEIERYETFEEGQTYVGYSKNPTKGGGWHESSMIFVEGPSGYYSILYGNDCISSVEIISSDVNDFERNGYVLPHQRIFKLNTRGF